MIEGALNYFQGHRGGHNPIEEITLSVIFTTTIFGLWGLAFASLPLVACYEGR